VLAEAWRPSKVGMNTRSYGAENTGMDRSTVFQISAYLCESLAAKSDS